MERGAARPCDGTDGGSVHDAIVGLRQAGGCPVSDVEAVLIQQEDRAERAGCLLLQAVHEPLEHVPQRRAAADEFHRGFLPVQQLLRPPAFRDVHHEGCHSDDFAPPVNERGIVTVAKDDGAILPDVFIRAPFAPGKLHEFRPYLVHLGAGFFRDDKGCISAESLVVGESENRCRGGIPFRDPEIQIPLDDRHRRLLEMQAQLLGGHR